MLLGQVCGGGGFMWSPQLDCELLDGQDCDMFIAESLAQHLKPLVLSKYLLSE